MITSINKILTDWSYCVSDGLPDVKNSAKLLVLENVLKRLGWSREESAELMYNLMEAGTSQYDSVADRAFIPDAIILEQKIDNVNGEVIIDIAGLGINSYASGSGTLFTVTFNTTSSGNATLTFNKSELRDDQNHQINHNIGSACKIYIN